MRFARLGAGLALLLLASCKQVLGLHERAETSDAGVSSTVAASACGAVAESSPSCASCMDQSCCSQVNACAADPACQESAQCLAACSDADCRRRCESFYSDPDGLIALRACRAKNCASACGNECGEFASVSTGCQTCRDASCCSSGAACGSNPDCIALDECRSQCFGSSNCLGACDKRFPQGAADYKTWFDCVKTCASMCQTGQDWACLDEPPTWLTPKAVPTLTFSVRFVNFTQGAPFAGLHVKACSKLDWTCAAPLDQAATDATGLVTVTVPPGLSGFDGYLDVNNADSSSDPNAVFASIFYPMPFVMSDGFKGNFELLSQAEIGTLAMITGAKVDPKRGHIALEARDCDFTPASAVAVTVDQMNVDEQSLTFYLINGIPAATAMATDASGIATVFNLMTSPLGSLAVVSATAGGANDKKLGSVSVIIRPGTLTTFPLPPEP